MKIGVPREIHAGERRVAATPETAEYLQERGYQVIVEAGAGLASGFDDKAYEDAGAIIEQDPRRLWQIADTLLKVRPPELHPDLDEHEADLLAEGAHLIGLVWPERNPQLVERLARRRATVLALDKVPRISRAQSVDVLSSMAGIAGYRAVIEAAFHYDGFFTPQMSATGAAPPARVLVIGAGVAGLAAIGQAHQMGATVKAFDTREQVREQVESLGAQFLEVDLEEFGEAAGGYAQTMSEEYIAAEMELFAEQLPRTDIVITTAAVPGKPAPTLLTAQMVESMPSGSVLMDLAAASGGNCEVTCPDEVTVHRGVTVFGPTDLANQMPHRASKAFAQNLAHLFDLLGGAQDFEVDPDDAVIGAMLVLRDGERVDPEDRPVPAAPEETPVDTEAASTAVAPPTDRAPRRGLVGTVLALAAAVLLLLVGLFAPPDFVGHFTVFVLACFVGWQVIWNVTPSLHTPLMSVTNAVSGIIVVGAILQMTVEVGMAALILAGAAIVVASINIFGGF